MTYILHSLAKGIQLDTADDGHTRQPQRPSLTQRLGINKQAEEAETDETHKRTVKCVELSGQDLYVGTNDGYLEHFTLGSLEIDGDTPPEYFKLNSIDLKQPGKRVEQLLAFPGLCKLAILCGSQLLFYTLPQLRPISQHTIKGVSCLSFDERMDRTGGSQHALLCVAKMKSIQIYVLGAHDMKLQQEVSIQQSVASLSMYGQYICLADTETYKILDLEALRLKKPQEEGQLVLLPTQQPYEDPETGQVVRPPRPKTLVVGPQEFMFLTSSGGDDNSTLGVIVTAMGEALRGTLQFASFPKSVLYDEPYLIASFGEGQVEVYDTRSAEQVLAQSIALTGTTGAAKLCSVAGFYMATSICKPVATTDSRAAEEDLDLIGLFGPADSPTRPQHLRRQSSELDTTPWTQALGENKDGPITSPKVNGLSKFVKSHIVLATDDSLFTLATQPQLVQADQLLQQQRVEEAVGMVERALESDVSLSDQSEEVTYVMQMAGMVCLRNVLLDDALHYFKRGMLGYRVLLHLFSEYAGWVGTELTSLDAVPLSAGLRRAIQEIGTIQKLVEGGAAQMAGEEVGGEQYDMLRATLMANSVEVLERYLEHCRKTNGPDKVIDTVLLRIYADNNNLQKIRRLLAKVALNVDLCCQYLMDNQKYYYCSLIYQAQGEEQRVVDIWRELLSGELVEKDDSQFGGLTEYLEYLQQISQTSRPIVLAEYRWLIDFEVDASLMLLTHLTNDSVQSLDGVDQIVDKMEEHGDQSLRMFIERLIDAQHPRAIHFMTYLVKVYVRQVRDSSGPVLPAVDEYRRAQADDLGLGFRQFLYQSASDSPTEGIKLRIQLMDALCANPPKYDPQAIFACIREDQKSNSMLAIERAILLVMLDRLDDAVDILVTEVQDYGEAELLLLQPADILSLAHYLPDKSTLMQENDMPQRVRKLLAMYLAIKDDDLAARLVSHLLSKYWKYLGLDVVQQIPDHWPYSLVASFVERELSQLAQQERALLMHRNIQQSLTDSTRTELFKTRCQQDVIELDYSQTCSKCHKLLGSSAFVYVADTREIRHISCT